MQVLFTRNVPSALSKIIGALKRGPGADVDGEPHRMLPFPITTVLGNPNERTMPWAWWHRNPFASFLGALELVVQTANVFADITEIDSLQTIEFNVTPGGGADQTVSMRKSPTGCLDMIVHERMRTDIGRAFGVSMVRYTMLHEYLSAQLFMKQGVYTHIIADLVASDKVLPNGPAPQDSYETGIIKPYDMVTSEPAAFIADAKMLQTEGPCLGIKDPFIRQVAAPIWKGFNILHTGEDSTKFGDALFAVGMCRASDWRFVCEEYIRQQAANFLNACVPDADAGAAN